MAHPRLALFSRITLVSSSAAGALALLVLLTPFATSGTASHNVSGVEPNGARVVDAAPSAPIWTEQNSNTDLTLRGIDCVDGDHCWVVGGEGEFDEKYVILRTENGGKHWGVESAPDAKRLESVSFVDLEYGWAVGVDGLILKTADGGRTWFKQNSGISGRKLTHVQFLDRQHGWVTMQREPTLLITSDGGATWEKQEIIVLEDPDDDVKVKDGLSTIFMYDLNLGWANGTDEVLLHTKDGGRTWVNQVSGTDRRLYGIFFLNPMLGWAVGSDTRKTVDGGETWVKKHKPANTGREVHFIDENRGFMAGDKGVVESTTDGGENWTAEATEFGERTFADFAVGSPDKLWVVGTGGFLIHRYDPDLKPTATSTPTPTNTPTNTPTPTMTPTPEGPWLRLAETAHGDPDAVLLVGPDNWRSLTAEYGNLGISARLSVTLEGPLVFADGSPVLGAPYSVVGAGVQEIKVRAAEGAETGDEISVWAAIIGDDDDPVAETSVGEIFGAIADVLGMPWVMR